MYLTIDEKEKIARENIKLAHYFANKYRFLGHEYEELFSAALTGFARALKSYDPSRGYKFTTFVGYTIKNEIYKYHRDINNPKRKGRTVSIDAVVFQNKDGSELTILDMLPDESESVNWRGVLKASERAMKEMKDIEREAFSLYILNGLTQTEISKVIGIHQVQVGRWIKKAFTKVKDEYWKEAVV